MIEVNIAAFELVDPGITGKDRLKVATQVYIIKAPVERIVKVKYTDASVYIFVADTITQVIEY
jgi:hypothetical protein